MFNFTISLLLSVSLIFIIKYFEKFNINTFQGIAFNYFTCVVTGIVFLENPSETMARIPDSTHWLHLPIILGILFITVFNLTGLTAQRIGVTIAMVASKISLIIPVLISLLFFKSAGKEFSLLNYFGIVISIVAIVLTTYKPNTTEVEEEKPSSKKLRLFYLLLPLLVFVGAGTCDTIANYTNLNYLKAEDQSLFSILVFLSAFLAGNTILLIRVLQKKEKLEFRNFVGGIVLGVPNYFSLYFMLKALSDLNNNGAFFFPVFNIGMILVTTLFAIVLFKEKLSKINTVGVLMALISIFFISNEEILSMLP
jgi:drug/metabolite transporter (DMT)-like permease